MSLARKALEAGSGRLMKELAGVADRVMALESDFASLSDDDLRGVTDDLRDRLGAGTPLADLTVEAFAAVREASYRTLEMRHFREQLIGGAALTRGMIAQIDTGQGKTLVATLPAYLWALEGTGVHVVTVNDYLATTQAEQMGNVYAALGMTCAAIRATDPPEVHRAAYRCDITYATFNELGFDYLRDNTATSPEAQVTRGQHHVLVDEVDSILIDESRTPLIIAATGAADYRADYAAASRLTERMHEGVHYDSDPKKRTVSLTDEGIDMIERVTGPDLYADVARLAHVDNALRAKALFHRGKDYIVAPDGEVLIVDENTGRSMSGRRYSEGLHQAIEAKEGVEVGTESITTATTTLQNFFRTYPSGYRAGMTGTVGQQAGELFENYQMRTVIVPPHQARQRVDDTDLVYVTHDDKMVALTDEVVERHEAGQPVLVGTASVSEAVEVAGMLKDRGLNPALLTAEHDAAEARVVAQAGRSGAVTVSTAMAGRGTDILLGGNPDMAAVDELDAKGLAEGSLERAVAAPAARARARRRAKADHEAVVQAGGLAVLSTTRHESARVDDQLRGRAGRQGDPGYSRFFLSLEDDLMRHYAGGLVGRITSSSAYPKGVPLAGSTITKAVSAAQREVEGVHADSRKQTLKYDDVIDAQRRVIYDQRQRVLDGEDVDALLPAWRRAAVERIADESLDTSDHPDKWDLSPLWEACWGVWPVSITPDEVLAEYGGGIERDDVIDELVSDMEVYWPDDVDVRGILLGVIDRGWAEHLTFADQMRSASGLRAHAQKDPLLEYREEMNRAWDDLVARLGPSTVVMVCAAERARLASGLGAGLLDGRAQAGVRLSEAADDAAVVLDPEALSSYPGEATEPDGESEPDPDPEPGSRHGRHRRRSGPRN